MVNENVFEMGERILRKVSPSGNGAHIFAPKEWIDEEVMVIRISKIDILAEILKVLQPYMKNIISALIFGSYARGEQNEKSDVDVLVIANKPIKIRKKGFDIIVISEDKIKMAKELNPVLIYSAIAEGKPIINSSFLENLRKEKVRREMFKEFYASTLLSLQSNKEIIALDKELGMRFSADSVAYSLFLRLRGIFIIGNLLRNEKYSNNKFRDWIIKEVPDLDFNSFYSAYASVREDKKTNKKISLYTGELLAVLLEREIKKHV